MSKVFISKELLEMIEEGKVRRPKEERFRLGRWMLRERVGIFIGSKGKGEGSR